MSKQTSARNATLLRLVVVYAAGILAADRVAAHGAYRPVLLPLTVTVVLTALGLCFGALSRRHASAALPRNLCLLGTVLMTGFSATQLHTAAVQTNWPEEPVDARLCVLSSPVDRAHTTRYKVDVAGQSVYMYLSANNACATYAPGDSLLVHAVTIRMPVNFSPDLTFDYARSLLHKDIAGTFFVKDEAVDVLPSNHRRGVFERWRLQLADKYAHEPLLGEKEQAVIRALTLGDRSALSDELRMDYATAGVSHVLALSGLHVGIIYLLLSFCFRTLFPGRVGRWVGEGLSVLALWVFALMSGCSPSIQRAVLMCSVYAVASLLSADRSPLDALSLTAWLMLCLNPFTLFDVGFQLSFSSMLSILCLMPANEAGHAAHTFPRRIWRYITGIITVSLVAQAGTLPLTLHYFGRFPTFFLLSNLLVLPVVSLTMWVAVMWWICSFLPFLGTLPGQVLNGYVALINLSVSMVSGLPGSSVAVTNFSWPEVILSYVALLFFVQFCRKKPGALLGTVVSVVAILFIRCLD